MSNIQSQQLTILHGIAGSSTFYDCNSHFVSFLFELLPSWWQGRKHKWDIHFLRWVVSHGFKELTCWCNYQLRVVSCQKDIRWQVWSCELVSAVRLQFADNRWHLVSELCVDISCLRSWVILKFCTRREIVLDYCWHRKHLLSLHNDSDCFVEQKRFLQLFRIGLDFYCVVAARTVWNNEIAVDHTQIELTSFIRSHRLPQLVLTSNLDWLNDIERHGSVAICIVQNCVFVSWHKWWHASYYS